MNPWQYAKSTIFNFFYTKYFPVTRYPKLTVHAKIMLCLFGSTYLCETTFSKMNFAKNKYRTSLTDMNLENTIRLSTTSIIPNIDQLVDRGQWHKK